jgi:hypothetical protein
MPYIKFQFQPGDKVYVGRYVDNVICPITSYRSFVVKTFFRLRNTNFYRLNDGRVFDEFSLIDEPTYQSLLIAEAAQSLDCLQQALVRAEDGN